MPWRYLTLCKSNSTVRLSWCHGPNIPIHFLPMPHSKLNLESKPNSQLKLPRRLRGEDTAEGPRIVRDILRQIEIRAIEQVERLHFGRKLESLGQIEKSIEGEIERSKPRAADYVAPCVAKRIWSSNREGTRIEPAIDAAHRDGGATTGIGTGTCLPISHDIGPVRTSRCAARVTGIAVVERNLWRDRLPRPRGGDTSELSIARPDISLR